MARYADTLTDEVTGAPIPGAFVYVYAGSLLAVLTDDNGGAIRQPIITPQTGAYYFNAADAVYQMRAYVGARLKRERDLIVGSPPAFRGATGPADNTYTTLTALQASDPTRLVARLVGDPNNADGNFSYVGGAWVRQSAAGVTFTADAAALTRDIQAKTRELPRSPADYIGIQPAINAATTAAGTNAHTSVSLGAVAAPYVLTAGLTINTTRASLTGGQLVDASALPSGGIAISLNSTPDSPLGNSYGFKPKLSIKLKGAGPTIGQVGIDHNGTTVNGAAQVDGDNVVLSGFQTGIRFSNRGYNSVYRRLDITNCGTAISWPAGGTDNGERNTLEAPTIANSGLAIDVQEPGATVQVLGGSIDFCTQQFNAVGGIVETVSVHHESSRWGQYAFTASGNGGRGIVLGGVVLNQAPAMTSAYLAFADVGAEILFDGVRFHNLTLIRPTADTPTCFFNGTGRGIIRNMHALDGSMMPDRFSITATGLADPSYEAAAGVWPDLVCITADTAAAQGATAPADPRHTGNNVTLTKTTSGGRSGGQALKIAKTGGAGSLASTIIMAKRCVPGEKLFSTTHYRTSTDAIPSDPQFDMRWVFAKFDRYDANGLPIFFQKQAVYTTTFIATAAYKMAVFGKADTAGTATPSALITGFAARTVPPWADYVYCEVDMFKTAVGAILFDDGSLDTVG